MKNNNATLLQLSSMHLFWFSRQLSIGFNINMFNKSKDLPFGKADMTFGQVEYDLAKCLLRDLSVSCCTVVLYLYYLF